MGRFSLFAVVASTIFIKVSASLVEPTLQHIDLFSITEKSDPTQGILDSRDSPSNEQLCAALTLAQEVGTRRYSLPPAFCEEFLKKHVDSHQYSVDFDTALHSIEQQVLSFPLKGDGSDAVILDVDETSLSNLPYYERNQYGVTSFNQSQWNEWVMTSAGVPYSSMVGLVSRLVAGNWSVVFLTGRVEAQREATTLNLQRAGYKGWSHLIMRSAQQKKLPATVYKSESRAQLEAAGLTIWANIGDQWSDLEGYSVGHRVFKLPNPFYFVG